MFKFWKKNKDENNEEKISQNPEETEGLSEEAGEEEEVSSEKGFDSVEDALEETDIVQEVVVIEDDAKNTEDNQTEEEYAEISDGDESDEEIIAEPEEDEKDDAESDIAEDGKDKEHEKKKGIFARLLAGLSKTKNNITGRIDDILKSYTKIDEDLLEELEEILITSDVGVNTTMYIIDRLKELIKERGIKDPLMVRELLKEVIEDLLSRDAVPMPTGDRPTVIVMVGVNGVGKTTTIGKLAMRYKKNGKKVMLAAADTFRAAATEQLDIWAKRVGVDIIKHHEGADPGAVVFDAVKAAEARKVDVLICDTAGRLHNKANLMNELGKIFKIIDREYPQAQKEVLLVVDATTGQNAVSQAKTFKEVANITGIVLTKLDGTAKGGVVLAVKSEVDVPVKLIGVGEKAEDLQDFDAKSFTEALFGE